MNKQKVIGLILGVVLFIALIAGLTYAYISWTSDNINLKVNSECFNILYDGGTSINGSIIPSVDYTGGRYVTVKMDLSSACTLVEAGGKIYLTTSNSTSSNLYEEGVLNYQLLINDEVTDIKGSITESGTIEIDVGQLNKNSVATTTYTVYVWVNGEYVTNEHASSTYYGNISAKAVQGTNTIYDYDYTGDVQVVNITQTGTYKLEVWGAQGGYGYNGTYRGGYGGYSVGEVNLIAGQTLYIFVGGQGANDGSVNNGIHSGGYNGGGNSYVSSTDRYIGSGGGATHIALSSGLLSSLSSNIDDILIVAGGGGAGGYHETYNSTGGDGGGYIGGTGTTTKTENIVGQGGTQTSGGTGEITGSFGQGASSSSSNATGGGGGFYGGGAGIYVAGSGGGSGYIGNPLLTNKIMYCYECKDSSEEADETDIKTRSTINVDEEAIPNYAKIGNGYARITYFSTN